jgi:hypothetical protein
MKGYLLQIITFIGLIAFHEEEAELPLQWGKAFPTTM